MTAPRSRRWARQLIDLAVRLRHLRLIVDTEKRVGDGAEIAATIPLLASSKEEVSREHVFGHPGVGLNFLDVGARDGALTYLLGISGNLEYDDARYRANLEAFRKKYNYYGMDLHADGAPNVLVGDICSPRYLDDHAAFASFFDVVYSNNVFEHLRQPWMAAQNILRLLRVGGLGIVITPFSQRYHQVPEDYFRYTHVGLRSLFEDAAAVEVMTCAYDVSGRRNDWQGSGAVGDVVPEDKFGAWRETWFTVLAFRKRAR
jgi:SAM-dependent methyltransferase